VNNNSKILIGAIVAAATGAVIGMLFAPEQGNKTRNKIKKSANTWATEVLEALEKGKGKVQSATDRFVKNGVALKDEAIEMTEERMESVKESINKK